MFIRSRLAARRLVELLNWIARRVELENSIGFGFVFEAKTSKNLTGVGLEDLKTWWMFETRNFDVDMLGSKNISEASKTWVARCRSRCSSNSNPTPLGHLFECLFNVYIFVVFLSLSTWNFSLKIHSPVLE